MVLFDDSTTNEHELSEDILAINTIFICRLQGRRAAKHRRERKKKKKKTLAKAIDGIGEIDL
ncbi:hypothetical protein C1645_759076 [Glomus cerebriforme]|uniref:Uncharacterized protein n=1 Tax=Glomus cerebriforme TaxID=658196 RepID=A0A397TEP3_9GLOM|nr:hypothetical protein C1645_759076 [Glomus cerebriforme]